MISKRSLRSFTSRQLRRPYGIAYTLMIYKSNYRIEGYQIAIDSNRRHHEIYLSDPRKTSADKLKTVIRYPIR